MLLLSKTSVSYSKKYAFAPLTAESTAFKERIWAPRDALPSNAYQRQHPVEIWINGKCWEFCSLNGKSVSQETSVCTLMGRAPPTCLCVPTERRADLVQLSWLHLERRLIQSWRRLAGDCILANSSTTNSIIRSMLVFASSLTLPCPPLPILVSHRSPFTSVSGIFRVARSLKYALSLFSSQITSAFHYFERSLGLIPPPLPQITFPLRKTKFLAV